MRPTACQVNLNGAAGDAEAPPVVHRGKVDFIVPERNGLPPLAVNNASRAIPRLSEPWYCCAEPTHEQLAVL